MGAAKRVNTAPCRYVDSDGRMTMHRAYCVGVGDGLDDVAALPLVYLAAHGARVHNLTGRKGQAELRLKLG